MKNNENYVELQIILAKARAEHDAIVNEEYENIVAALETLTEDAASKLNFIYNESVEGILNTNYTEILAELSRKIHNAGELTLAETINFVTLSKTADCEDVSEDDLKNMKDIFGEENFDIPASNDGAYRVTLNAIGKGKAIKCLRNLQKKIDASVDIVNTNLKENIDPESLKEAMKVLVEANYEKKAAKKFNAAWEERNQTENKNIHPVVQQELDNAQKEHNKQVFKKFEDETKDLADEVANEKDREKK